MLVFFIHGVATHDVKYADKLKNLIKEEFDQQKKSFPHFYSSFWGDVLRDVGKIWNWIHQDLQEAQREYKQADIDNLFRYRQFREGFLSEFVGDFFSYFNPERGTYIRKLIAAQLHEFIKNNPEETELHIVTHSLGSVILWDVLFSERFSSLEKGPAIYIRSMLNGFSESGELNKVKLKSITTMGSPILFLNIMLEVNPNKIKQFANTYQNEHLRWINIIHSSDVVAYPLRSSLNLNSFENLVLRDEYISTDANLAEKAARTVGQVDAAMAIGGADAHVGYWQCQQTARLVTDNLLGLETPMIQKVVSRLHKVPGMTNDAMQLSRRAFIDNTLAELKFRDGSGILRFCNNPLKIHHVYIFDRENNCEFVGYVGWIHSEGLKEEIKLIEKSFG
ncbi:hypothetical protein NDI39_19280 [Microcoleus sp. ZQ-A2]|nr:hypothetical protein [Microcoleus sp. FACHB-1]